ncbi:uncharacterized protein GIQ15_00460 [Arthroderma uncinatum]|uniref:uncharacterized protein n=1 Tax=Arthroderma uncinatum TaxID=74035 RepID=UPI00144AD11D|nr:uncharacterized protein GIQ15_00460 [Arthroderma uncinatum]KAF3490943.1 hypothetical protein GIQ15_00460 [Arthroderma uncinatum]
MEQKVLAIHHKSLKRKRNEAEHSDEALSLPSHGTQHDAENMPESHDQGAMKASGTCPQGTVASRLQDLDIQSPAAMHEETSEVHATEEKAQPGRIESIKEQHTSDHATKPLATSTETPALEGNENIGDKADIATKPSPSTSKARSDMAESSHPSSPPPCHETASIDPDEESLTWDDSEITGHHATDPNDDGYGLNGIGFKPSAEVAWDRSQRRKEQVAEWERREAREAREARSRRRRTRDGIDPDMIIAADNPKQKRVKFDD